MNRPTRLAAALAAALTLAACQPTAAPHSTDAPSELDCTPLTAAQLVPLDHSQGVYFYGNSDGPESGRTAGYQLVAGGPVFPDAGCHWVGAGYPGGAS